MRYKQDEMKERAMMNRLRQYAAFGSATTCDVNGSIIVIVLIILAMLTLSGLMAVDMSMTESYIVKNTGTYMQNLALAEAAAAGGVQYLITNNRQSNLMPGGANGWINRSINANPASMALSNSNSAVPTEAPSLEALEHRKEVGKGRLRYYFVGWQGARLNSLKATGPTWHTGKVVGVYKSPEYGFVRVAIGVRKKF